MRALSAYVCGFVLLALAGCGSGSSPGTSTPNPPPVQGLLSPVTDAAAFEASIKDGLTAMASAEQLAVADVAAAAGGGNFTGTYTQEFNVDELDAVRYDGTHLYVAPRRFFYCCFILAEAGAPADDARPEPERSIRILATDPANGDASVVSRIPLADGHVRR